MCRLQAIGGTMRLPPDKVCRLIRKLYASTSSPFEHEAEVAKEKLRVLLFEHSLTEADIPAILAASDDHGQKLSSARSRVRAGSVGRFNALLSLRQGPVDKSNIAVESSARPSEGGRPGRQKGTHAIPDRPNSVERQECDEARAPRGSVTIYR
jgi:hypothetical protein